MKTKVKAYLTSMLLAELYDLNNRMAANAATMAEYNNHKDSFVYALANLGYEVDSLKANIIIALLGVK